MIDEKQVLNIYERILNNKKKVNTSVECKRIAKIFDCNPKKIWDIVTKEEMPVVTEADFKEEDHPRGGSKNAGQFTSKGGSGTKKTKDKKEKKNKEPKEKKPIKKQKLTQNADPRKLKMFEDIKKHFGDKGIKIDEEKTFADIERGLKEYSYVDYVRTTFQNKSQQLLAYAKITNAKVNSRTKDTLSSVGKLIRKPEKYKSLDDLTDRVGVRIVVSSNAEVESFVALAKSNFIVTEEKNHIKDGHKDGSGYRSHHIIVEDPDTNVKAEFQIRTENQHIWAEAMHTLMYKPENKRMEKYRDENKEELTTFTRGLSEYYFSVDNGDDPPNPPNPPEVPHSLKVMGFDFETELEQEPEYIEKYGKDYHPIKNMISAVTESEESNEASIFDLMIDEREEMTPDEGFNVCLFDDFAPYGEMLTLVGNYEDEESANQIAKECEKQGKVAYVYPSKVLYTEDDIEEGNDVEKYAKDLLEYEKGEREVEQGQIGQGQEEEVVE